MSHKHDSAHGRIQYTERRLDYHTKIAAHGRTPTPFPIIKGTSSEELRWVKIGVSQEVLLKGYVGNCARESYCTRHGRAWFDVHDVGVRAGNGKDMWA
jgi:hypothetical protein